MHLVRPRTNTLLLEALEQQPVWEQHSAIYEAIKDQDPDRAVRTLEDHVDYLASVQHALHDETDDNTPVGSLPTPGPS